MPVNVNTRPPVAIAVLGMGTVAGALVATAVTVGVTLPAMMLNVAATPFAVTVTSPDEMLAPDATVHVSTYVVLGAVGAVPLTLVHGTLPPPTVTASWPGLVPKPVPLIVSVSADPKAPLGMLAEGTTDVTVGVVVPDST